LAVSSDERDPLINFVHGIDVYDDNVNNSTTDKRDWFLGSFLHSRPYVIHYADRTVIYAGANDGSSCLDDASLAEPGASSTLPPDRLRTYMKHPRDRWMVRRRPTSLTTVMT
jgi:hypothetical protein